MKYLNLSLLLGLLGAVLAGCATSPVRHREGNLTRCGFKAVTATNASQQKLMHTLPADRISHVVRKGKDFYVFPDHGKNVLYVGNPAQYHAYQQYLADQQLAADAKMAQEVYDAPRLSADAGLGVGEGGGDNEGGWSQAWHGWDAQDAY